MEKNASWVLPKDGSTKLQWAVPMAQPIGQLLRLLLKMKGVGFITHSSTHSLTHPLTHSLTNDFLGHAGTIYLRIHWHSPSDTPTHPQSHGAPLTHCPPIHSPTHSCTTDNRTQPRTLHSYSIQFDSPSLPCLIHQVCHLISENSKQRSYRTKHTIPSVPQSELKKRNVRTDVDVIVYLRISFYNIDLSAFHGSECRD